jgi:hypothetical protein
MACWFVTGWPWSRSPLALGYLIFSARRPNLPGQQMGRGINKIGPCRPRSSLWPAHSFSRYSYAALYSEAATQQAARLQ